MGVLAAVVLCLGGCTTTASDRAGGRGLVEPTVLQIAQPNDIPPPQVQAYADEADKLSHGSLLLSFKDQWRKGDVEYERHTLEDVLSGRMPGAWVGIRSLDLVGVTSFQPLEAPLLVDSQALQDRIFSEGIPLEMGRGLNRHGLAVVAVLPGPMRKVLGVRKPFREPADFRGAILGIQDGRVMRSTALSLGATFKPMPTGAKLAGVDAYEHHVENIFDSHYGLEAKYVTANVNLWPRAMAVVMNDAAYRSLTDGQRDVLRRASVNVVPAAMEATRAQDETDLGKLCGQGVTFPPASAQQIVALRRAVQPVYDELAREPGTARMLERLAGLKATVSASPDTAACPASGSGAADGTFPEGTFDMVLDNAAGTKCPEGQQQGSRGKKSWFRLEVRNGTVTMYERIDSPAAPEVVGYNGVYASLRDRVRIDNLSARWSFNGTTLRLSSMTGGSCGDAVIWTTQAWVKRSAAAAAPGSASQLDGTYETVLTPNDQMRCDGLRDGQSLNPDGHPVTTYFGFTLNRGELQGFARHGSRSAPPEHGPEMTVRVYRNVFELRDNDDGHVDIATFSFDGRTLTLKPAGSSWGCQARVVWSLNPWTLTKKAP